MKNVVLFLCMFCFCLSESIGQEGVIFTGEEKHRVIEKGKGQKFTEAFVDLDFFHFVQFGVYPRDVDRELLLAPADVGQVWLIWHKDTQIKGTPPGSGALYIVQPFQTMEDAKAAVATYRSRNNIRCWYNKELTGITFSLIASTTPNIKVE